MPRLALALAVMLAGAQVIAADPPAGGRHAVVVGVNTYRHPKLEALKYAVNDAAELADVLAARGYEVTLLTDAAGAADPKRAPTKRNIEAALGAVLRRCQAGDVAVVALAGHGVQFEGVPGAFFCPADARPFPDEAGSLVSLATVYGQMDKSFAGMKVLLVDACRDDPTAGRGSRGIDANTAPRPPDGVAALFSCKAGERAFEVDELRHGVFIHHVLEGLRGAAEDADGEVTFTGLAGHVSRRVAKDVPRLIKGGARQSPHLRADYTVEPVLSVRSAVVVAPSGQGGDYTEVAEAVRKARPGARIKVRPGVYTQGVVLDKPVDIAGDGPRDKIVLRVGDADCVFMATGRATVRGLTLECVAGKQGKKYFGVDVPQGQLLLADCDITSDSLACVGIHGEKADPVVRGCTIRDVKSSGLFVYDGARGTVADCDIAGNGMSGVEIKAKADPVVRKCRITDGKVGGAVVSDGGRGTVADCDIRGNAYTGVEIKGGADPVVRKCRINRNVYQAVWVYEKGLGTVEGCDLTDNKHGAFHIAADSTVVRKNNKE